MGFLKKLLAGKDRRESDAQVPAQINAGPCLGEVRYNPDMSVLMQCCECGTQVVVDRHKLPIDTVYCMPHALDLIKRSGLKAEIDVDWK